MQPSSQQWERLYEAAIAFKAAEPWSILENDDLFAVKDPNSELTGYCCVMGAGGEVYGMALYLGRSGLDTLLAMFNDEIDEDPLFVQHCLMLSFDDREDLHPKEKDIIKKLGLKFRGRGAWPSFKLHEPGYYPWLLEQAHDVSFLTEALEQAIQVAATVREDPHFLHSQNDLLLHRVGKPQSDGVLAWQNEWQLPAEENEKQVGQSPYVPNELLLAKLKKTIKSSNSVWEIDLFFVPAPVMEQERPYFPMALAVMDQDSQQIIAMHMFEQTEAPIVVPQKFIELLQMVKQLPDKLVAPKAAAFQHLSPVIDFFSMSCFIQNGPLMLDDFKQSLFERFGRN
ncbi:DUF7309 domain-containing protein [Paenibacillus sinopodophylli]|uniref:DUF7309 domain-containing protein n=1 Tax=Paenibacillus sinopodophylli TaxID=1837342 RepID=UPI00110D0E19|nr:hypothetical protein [Paenibacillus sinopodophylli]